MKNYSLILLLFIFGCSAESQFQKAVNKYGQKESAKFIVSNYPEYFIRKIDTVRDTVIVKETKVDSGFSLSQLKDTVFISKDRLVLKSYTKHDSIFIDAKCKKDTIYKLVQCPEIKPDYSKLNSKEINWIELITFLGIGLFFIILLIWWRKTAK